MAGGEADEAEEVMPSDVPRTPLLRGIGFAPGCFGC